MKIFLLGMPLSGKSTLGKALAGQLEINFYDLDKLIEATEIKSVGEIFLAHGEEYFRMLERNALEEVLNREEDFILACGGGTPCFYNNIELINHAGLSIFLDVPLQTLCERALTQRTERPLLKTEHAEDIKSKLSNLFDERIGIYQQAHYTISGSNITPAQIIDLIKFKM